MNQPTPARDAPSAAARPDGHSNRDAGSPARSESDCAKPIRNAACLSLEDFPFQVVLAAFALFSPGMVALIVTGPAPAPASTRCSWRRRSSSVVAVSGDPPRNAELANGADVALLIAMST
jgi:hypothetical protein